ncbi:MAG: glycerol-3-phosphate dehydrogenase [Actinobacteria bacterium]|nr:glycerol-3-phosphate dehydrogenase [Actinomycetota bacterium]
MGLNINSEYKIAMIGAGAWASTIAQLLAENGAQVRIWTHRADLADHINQTRQHDHKLPEIRFHERVYASPKLESVLDGVQAVVMGVASPYIQVAEQVAELCPSGMLVLSLTKGLVAEQERGSEYLERVLPAPKLAILSGPNLAKEIALKQPATSVVAAKDPDTARFFQERVSNDCFRAYTSADVVGVELGGILKNCIAIAAGCVDGLGLGSNTKAALMTRGLQEMIRFGMANGAEKNTFFGLSGLGDLIATCGSNLSRNYQVGYQVAKGKRLSDIQTQLNSVAEGVRACKLVTKSAQEKGIELPIISEVYRVLYEDASPLDAIQRLMARDLKEE